MSDNPQDKKPAPHLRLVSSDTGTNYPYTARISFSGNMRGEYPFELGEEWAGAFEDDAERHLIRQRVKHAVHYAALTDYKIIEDATCITVFTKTHADMEDFRIAIGTDDDFEQEKLFEPHNLEKTPENLESMSDMFNAIINKAGLQDVCRTEIDEEYGVIVIMRGKRGHFGFWQAMSEEAEYLERHAEL